MSPSVSRRSFLKQAAVAAALPLASATPAAERQEENMLPIIDTHQHLWDLERFRLPWLRAAAALNRSYVMADYLEAAAEVARSPGTPPAKIVKTVYMEVDVAPEQQQAEADYVVAICKGGQTPMVAAVVSGRPAAEDFARYARQFQDSPYVKGMRQVLHGGGTPPGYCLEKHFIRGIRLLGELGLSFDLCLRPAELLDGARLLDACPDTRFILDHCGNANVQAKDLTQWRKDMAEVARRKNVACKVSGIVASAAPGQWGPEDLAPIINYTLEVFGADRVVFGGDWPVCTRAATLRQWVDALRTVVRDRPVADQRKLFHDNALRVYRLG